MKNVNNRPERKQSEDELKAYIEETDMQMHADYEQPETTVKKTPRIAYNIDYDCTYEDLVDYVASIIDLNDAIAIFKLPVDNVATLSEKEVCELAYDSLRHNRVTAEELFDLPDRIEIPADVADEDLADYISDETGYCIRGYHLYNGVDIANESSVRSDFKGALEQVEHGYELSSVLGYGFSSHCLSQLAKVHKEGDTDIKRKVEELLEDCNFHTENADFINGEYEPYLKVEIPVQKLMQEEKE